jgi:hypothetical protein
MMKPGGLRLAAALSMLCVSLALVAQDAKPGLLSIPELKQFVPAVYFFRGQSATVQIRNAAGFRAQGGRLVLAALVDTSGYSQDVSERYQGLFITEVKLSVNGTTLPAGQYGFGFSQDGKFVVMDVGATDVLSVASTIDENLRRPVPLKMAEDGAGYRLYSGRKYVSLKGL